MTKELLKQIEEIDNVKLDNRDLEKIKCDLKIGRKIKWLYKEDLAFYKEEGIEVEYPFKGIVLPLSDVDTNRELDLDQVVILMTDYPVEKEYCEATYFTLVDLLSNKDLVGIY